MKNSGAMIDKLISWVVEEKRVDIQFDFLDEDQWAFFTMYEYDDDKEISLRLHLNDHYVLHLGYYDKKDDFFEELHPLTEEEKSKIPPSLNKLMKKVVSDEQGLSVSGKLIKA